MSDLEARLRHRVVPAVPVPFARDGRIDADAQTTYVRWMARQRVGGVAVWAHTGRGLRLDDEQRALVLAAWREGLGDAPIVCGVGVPAATVLPSGPRARTDAVIEANVRLAQDARRGGAAAVLIHPPTALRDTDGCDARVVALHHAVAEVGIPVIAFYLYEAAGGIAYAPRTVELLLEIEGVIGIKVATLDSVMTFQTLAALTGQHLDALLFTGEDRFLGYSLMLGARAALIGLGAACTDVCAALLDAWFGGDMQRFVRQAALLDAFAQATFIDPMEGYVQRMLWALAVDGVLPATLDPFVPLLDREQRSRVAAAVRALRAG